MGNRVRVFAVSLAFAVFARNSQEERLGTHVSYAAKAADLAVEQKKSFFFL